MSIGENILLNILKMTIDIASGESVVLFRSQSSVPRLLFDADDWQFNAQMVDKYFQDRPNLSRTVGVDSCIRHYTIFVQQLHIWRSLAPHSSSVYLWISGKAQESGEF